MPSMIKSTLCFLMVWVIGLLLGAEVRSVETMPISRLGDRTKDSKIAPGIFGDHWWANRFLSCHQVVESYKGQVVDLVMLGDSIMHFWEWKHPMSWARFTEGKNVLNLGYGGDKTENVIWRIEHGELDGYTAKAVMLMIGTNNNYYDTTNPTNVALAIEKIVKIIGEKQPKAKIFMCAILPRGNSSKSKGHSDVRRRNDITNEVLREFAKHNPDVRFLDMSKDFLDESGWVPASLMADQVHPTDAGYDILIKAVKDLVF